MCFASKVTCTHCCQVLELDIQPSPDQPEVKAERLAWLTYISCCESKGNVEVGGSGCLLSQAVKSDRKLGPGHSHKSTVLYRVYASIRRS